MRYYDLRNQILFAFRIWEKCVLGSPWSPYPVLRHPLLIPVRKWRRNGPMETLSRWTLREHIRLWRIILTPIERSFRQGHPHTLSPGRVFRALLILCIITGHQHFRRSFLSSSNTILSEFYTSTCCAWRCYRTLMGVELNSRLINSTMFLIRQLYGRFYLYLLKGVVISIDKS